MVKLQEWVILYISLFFLEKSMLNTRLTPTDIYIPFFDEPIKQKQLCKVYNDGGHYIAFPYIPTKNQKKRNDVSIEQEIFDSLYVISLKNGDSGKKQKEFLFDNMAHLFDNEQKLNAFISKQLERKAYNLYQRKKRLKRKANLNRWTHFITITYDDEKCDEKEFKSSLRKCLSNLHTRRKWRYMGVFERAPETKRLHFHALLCVPDGQMIGELTEKQDYSTKRHKMQKTIENSFFSERFGRNDFMPISRNKVSSGQAVAYLTKYIKKTDERITYSRNIPEYIYKEIEEKDIACEMKDFVLKYVLFDNVIDWEKDVAHATYEQMIMSFGALGVT